MIACLNANGIGTILLAARLGLSSSDYSRYQRSQVAPLRQASLLSPAMRAFISCSRSSCRGIGERKRLVCELNELKFFRADLSTPHSTLGGADRWSSYYRTSRGASAAARRHRGANALRKTCEKPNSQQGWAKNPRPCSVSMSCRKGSFVPKPKPGHCLAIG